MASHFLLDNFVIKNLGSKECLGNKNVFEETNGIFLRIEFGFSDIFRSFHYLLSLITNKKNSNEHLFT